MPILQAPIPAISLRNLSKVYSNGHEALKGINLDIPDGSFFALLGPNGAGKSTTIGILTGIVNATSGDVSVYGTNFRNDPTECKRHIGVVPQEFNFGIFDTILDIVLNQAGYYGISRKEALPRAEKYLKALSLWEKRNDQSRMLSGGMKRRLMIARGLIHSPRILILDEPTAGVDIELRRGMWEFLETLNKEGVTIILTTHYLEEAEALCDRAAIISEGKIIEVGEMKTLLAGLDEEVFVLDKENGESEEVTLKKGERIGAEIAKREGKGEQVVSMRNKTNRLEALFLARTTKK